MPIALIIGPAAALVGVIAIFFVLRRKSVDKRSMYSARRSQIEHKVRAARQRTLAPHGRTEKVAEPAAEAAPTSTSTWAAPTPQATYEASAFEPPPAAPPPPTKGRQEAPSEAPSQSPWDVGTPSPTQFATPEAPPQFAPPEAPPEPAYAPTYPQAPSEPVWTPAPAPSEPARPIEPEKPDAASPAAWSVVSEAKESAQTTVDEPKKKRGKRDAADAPPGGWALASGNAPGMEAEDVIKPPSQLIALAQYAILVVGLVMVLIGVLVMVANSHGT
jgi:hypothetical protein